MITDPTDIAGCRAWYDASDATTITLSGGQVTQWQDKSGNSYNATGAPAGLTVASAAQNGLDALRFTPGSSNRLRYTSAMCGGNTTTRSFAFVVRYEDAAKGCTLSMGNSSGSSYGQIVWLVNDATTEIAVNVGGTGGSDRTESDAALDLGSYYIVIVTISYDSGTGDKTVTYNINGVDDTPDTVNIGAGLALLENNFNLGWYANDADLYLAEVAIFNTVLSSSDIADLFDYFNNKWAVVAGAALALDDDSFSIDDTAAVDDPVGTVAATGGTEPYSYAITAGNEAGLFAIDSATGEITVADDLTGEGGNSFDLTVEVTDDASNTDDATVTIDVNDTVSDAISFADFADGQVIQRAAGGTSKSVTIAGTYTGSPTAIEIRVVENGTDTPVTGLDWQTLDDAPSGGTFSGEIEVPQGGWYNIDLRFAGGGAPLFGGTNRWGVGVNVFMIGQSNMNHMRTTSSSPPAANADISMHNGGLWAAPAGNGLITLGNALNDALGVPVGLVEYAIDGTAIGTWDPGSSWTSALAGSNAAGGDCEFVLWHQGESDAIAGTTKASYKASLAAVYAQCLAATGRSAAELPFLVGLLSTILTPPFSTETDATWQAIKDAHVEFCDETAGAHLSANYVDVDRGGDIIHMSAAGYATAGQRFAQSILYLLGAAGYGGAGPRISSATIDGTTVHVRIEHDGGGDFTPASGITGFEVLDDGTPVTITSAAREDANTIALELAAAPGGVVTLRYQYGESPDITGEVKDETALALPLLYANGLPVGTPSSAQIGARRLAVGMTLGL